MVRPSPQRPPAPRRPPARGLAAPLLCACTWLTGCGAAPVNLPGVPPTAGPSTATRSRASASHLLDLTERPGTAVAVVALAVPAVPDARPALRARLDARLPALRAALAPWAATVGLASVDGAPTVWIEAPTSAYAGVLEALGDALAAEAGDAAHSPSPALLPGDALDALTGEGARPGRPVVVVVRGPLATGAVEAESPQLEALGRHLASLASAPSHRAGAAATRGPSVRVLRRGGAVAHLAMAVALPDTAAAPGAELLAALLAGGAESRLSRALTAAGLDAATAAAELRPGPGVGTLVLGASLRPDDADAAWRVLASVRRGLRETPPTSAEVARARAHLADRDAFARGTASAFARRRVQRLVRADDAVETEHTLDARLDAWTTAALGGLAAEVARAPVRGLLTTPTVDAEVDDDLWAESLAEAVRPEGPAGLAAPEVRPGVHRLTDGLDCVVHSRSLDTLVGLELRISGGAALEPPELPGVAALATAVVGRPADAAAFEVSARLERDAVILSVTAPAERFPEALELIGRRLARFPQRADVFEEARLRVSGRRAALQTDALALSVALAEQGFADPRVGRDLLGTPAGLAERTPVEIRSFLEARIASRPMTLAVVGPLEAARVLPAVRAVLGPFAAGAPSAPAAALRPPPARLSRHVDADRTCVAAAYALPAGSSSDAAAEILAALLRPATRIDGPTGAALVVARCAPTVDEARTALATDVGRLAVSGPIAPALLAARRLVAAEHARNGDAPVTLAARLAEAATRGLPVDGDDPAARWTDRLEAVGAGELRTLAAALPPLNEAVQGIAGPSTSP
jgi:predicted Zn-dependent peptidase